MARTKGSKNSKPRAKKVVPDTIEVEGIEYTLDKIDIRDDGLIKKSNRHIRDIIRDIEEDVFDMNPLIQRTNTQWTIKQCTKLIMSILKGRPIGIITTAVVGSNEILVDGLQRLTTIKNFMEDKFKLSKEGCVISCSWVSQGDKVVTKDIDLGGKCYSQLPTAFKKMFADTLVDHHQYWYFDDEEIEDIMYCMNNGSPFKPWQKIRTRLGETRIEAIQPILEGTAWEKIHGCNDKNDTTLGLVIRTMMLLDGCGFNSLSVGAAEKYVNEIVKDGISTYNTKVSEVAKLFEDFDYVATHLPEEDWSFFDVTNTPQVLANIDEYNRSEKSLDEYIDFLHKFINDELDDTENNIREYNNVKNRSKGSGTKEVGYSVIEARFWIFSKAMDNYFFGDEDVEDDVMSDSDIVDNSKISKNGCVESVDDILDGMEFNTEIITDSDEDELEYEDITFADTPHWNGTDDCDDDLDDGRDDEYNLDKDDIYVSSYSAASSY